MGTQTRILDSAERLFNQQGYIAVGVDLIRDEAGLSKTTMYKYYRSKQALILAVLERRHDQFMHYLTQAMARKTEKQEKLYALIDWHINWFKESDFFGCMFFRALYEFSYQDPAIVDLAKQHKKSIEALIYQGLEEDENQKVEAIYLMVLLEGLINYALLYGADSQEFELAQRAIYQHNILAHKV